MLVIRRAQIEPFKEHLREPFVLRMVAHAREYFPADCADLTPEELRVIVRDGIARAEKYGFENERDATRFLNLMFTFGRQFDRDPTLGWATRLLARAGRADSGSLMNRLYVEGLRHESEGQGLNGRGQTRAATPAK